MEDLKEIILSIIKQTPGVDWLIIHKLEKVSPKIADTEFLFTDGKLQDDHPFNTNQGYISLESQKAISSFIEIIDELADQLKENSFGLANLFVIITRLSYKHHDETVFDHYKIKLGAERRTDVFNILITSLNQEYFKGRDPSRQPENLNKWLNLFVGAQYIHHISDPIIACLTLIRDERSRDMDFHLIQMMNPLLRSVLIGMYGYDLSISKNELQELSQNKNEVAFLAACLIDDTGPAKIPPRWLTSELIESCINNHWEIAGKYIFNNVFGISHRNKNQNELYLELGRLISSTLVKKLLSEDLSPQEWIKKLEFPIDFITLFEWSYVSKLDLNRIPTENGNAVTSKLISELQRLSDSIPLFISSENNDDPFISYQIHEEKYQNALGYVLLHLLYASNEDKKRLENICHDFKPLFYGGYKSVSLATHFTEFMLLTFLSGPKITGMDEINHKTLNGYLKMLSTTIMIPYIHLAERDDDIWDIEKEELVPQYSAGKYLVAKYIQIIRGSSMSKHYKNFLDSIDEVAVAKWE